MTPAQILSEMEGQEFCPTATDEATKKGGDTFPNDTRDAAGSQQEPAE